MNESNIKNYGRKVTPLSTSFNNLPRNMMRSPANLEAKRKTIGEGAKKRAPRSVGKSVPNFSLFHEIREEVIRENTHMFRPRL